MLVRAKQEYTPQPVNLSPDQLLLGWIPDRSDSILGVLTTPGRCPAGTHLVPFLNLNSHRSLSNAPSSLSTTISCLIDLS